ncbi:MAG: NCS2 family permease [Candidatus Nomurabacteria bacterium]|jgi:AGZA family xanthine/uracil permease-like MFS transporter|nr:NCS2 family permease [Candidatus Nomurabacteria bacterium]
MEALNLWIAKTWFGRYFGLRDGEKGIEDSKFSKELLGGTVTFMSMAYILAVQPYLMGKAGMPEGAVFASTAFIIAISTITMGVYSKFPFALAPGMGTNAIVMGLVTGGLADWQTAIGLIFISGLIFMLTSFRILKWTKPLGAPESVYNFSLREIIVDAIPVPVKLGLGVIIGLFLGKLALSATSGLPLDTGNWTDPATLIGVVMLIITASLFFLKNKNGQSLFPGAVLAGIIVTAIILFVTGLAPMPEEIVKEPDSFMSIFGKLEIFDAFKFEYFPYILVFFMGDFFSTTGTSLSCSRKAGFMDDAGNVPSIEKVFHIDSLFSVIGAWFGLTTVTTYVESASGVESGGRTGITALVTAFWFFVALLFSPLFLALPPIATGVGLAVVGLSMLAVVVDVNDFKNKPSDFVSVMFMILFMFITNDFAAALCATIIFCVIVKIIEFFAIKEQKMAEFEKKCEDKGLDPKKQIVYIISTNAVMFAMGILYFVSQVLAPSTT